MKTRSSSKATFSSLPYFPLDAVQPNFPRTSQQQRITTQVSKIQAGQRRGVHGGLQQRVEQGQNRKPILFGPVLHDKRVCEPHPQLQQKDQLQNRTLSINPAGVVLRHNEAALRAQATSEEGFQGGVTQVGVVPEYSEEAAAEDEGEDVQFGQYRQIAGVHLRPPHRPRQQLRVMQPADGRHQPQPLSGHHAGHRAAVCSGQPQRQGQAHRSGHPGLREGEFAARLGGQGYGQFCAFPQ